MHFQSALTIVAGICIFLYRITSGALDFQQSWLQNLDTVNIVNIFWTLLIMQFVYEILTYIGAFKVCCGTNRFGYTKPKEKSEDYHYDEMAEPWNIDDTKLNLARSLSHLMLNDMMLIVTLLMRPHNVIMIPSVVATCYLTARCLDHSLLDPRTSRSKEIADLIGQTLAHIWIGMLFFFYQVILLTCFFFLVE